MNSTADIAHRATISAAGDKVNEMLQGYGFVLLAFDTNKKIHYVSNVERDDMTSALEAFRAALAKNAQDYIY